MSDHLDKPNGAQLPDPAPMTPQERRLWSASHALPEIYLLVTREEMQVMSVSMAQQRAVAGALQRTFKECEVLLADYWKNEPDLPNGVAAAVFDANRYKKAVDLVLPHLRKLKANLAALPTSEHTATEALYASRKHLDEQIALLDKQTNLRRDRKGKS